MDLRIIEKLGQGPGFALGSRQGSISWKLATASRPPRGFGGGMGLLSQHAARQLSKNAPPEPMQLTMRTIRIAASGCQDADAHHVFCAESERGHSCFCVLLVAHTSKLGCIHASRLL